MENKDNILKRCSLCRGIGMVSQTNGMMIKCPVCSSKPDIIDVTNILINGKTVNENEIKTAFETISNNINILKKEESKQDIKKEKEIVDGKYKKSAGDRKESKK